MSDTPSDSVSRTGPEGRRDHQSCFLRLGLRRDWDFVLHAPLRYEDETEVTPIAALQPEAIAQVQGRVTEVSQRPSPRFKTVYRVTLSDDSGSLDLTFFRYCDRRALRQGETIRVYGQAKRWQGGLSMVQPRVRAPARRDSDLPRALTPVYPSCEGLPQYALRRRVSRALLSVNLSERIPADLLAGLGLIPFVTAINAIHHPDPEAVPVPSDPTDPNWRRLIFDELLAQQVTLRLARAKRGRRPAPAFGAPPGALARAFLASLPFELTGSQRQACQDCDRDLSQDQATLRLIAGDVGSGKTVIAAYCAVRAHENAFQCALMAPTEILARQHFGRLDAWLQPLGLRSVLLLGGQPAAERRAALAALADGSATLAIGTHALIQEQVSFARLGLAVIDEQHRFGVAQRLRLSGAAGEKEPHQLLLTATPIPRTLAMSYYADIDVSFLRDMPPGRLPIITRLVSLKRLTELVRALDDDLAAGRQAYWVCPLIEESEDSDLTAAISRAEELSHALPGRRVALLHGRMSGEEKQSIMGRFAAGEIDLLVSTTVIEVGIDVANATVMVIERAERFGLAQLHQMRGRVGRGARQSSCVLLYDPELGETGRERLRVMRESDDGFAIARRDLQLRGPGEFLGSRQSGRPLMRFADPERDEPLLRRVIPVAEEWLRRDPEEARRFAERWFDPARDYLKA